MNDIRRALAFRIGGWALAAATLLAASSARAQLAARESSEAPPPSIPAKSDVRIWYRSSEGCPDGEVFVARLRELGRTATLARIGDRIDFVVTLAADPERSEGNLERQTASGTVAVRQLGAERCEDVAEALALTLELALQPTSEVEQRTESAPLTPDAAPAPTLSQAGSAESERPEPSGLEQGAAAPAALPLQVGATGARLSMGAQGHVVTGLAPAVAPGAALFAELGGAAKDPKGRLSIHFAYRRASVSPGDVEVGQLAARVEACAFGWGSGALSVQPCAGVDAGVLQASSTLESGQTDRGLWAGGLAHLRAGWQLWPRFWPEVQAGVILPFVRYSLGVEGGDVYRTEPLLVQLSLGARWSP